MKKRLFLAALAAIAAAVASPSKTYADPLLSLGGLADLIAEKAKESRAATFLTLDEKYAGGAYLPVWTFTDASRSEKYLTIGIGGQVKQGESARPCLPIAVNLTALSARLWSSRWAQEHVIRTKMPPVWVGPFIRVPLPGERDWTIRENVGASISFGIGGS